MIMHKNKGTGRSHKYKISNGHHLVRSHRVRSYVRRNGTVVRGFWRDGDHNPRKNSYQGYYAKNPSR